MTKDNFIYECEKLGIKIDENILSKLEKYKELLISWNEKFNLTSITSDSDIYLKHFYDSLCIVKKIDLNNNIKLCDFGTGAGFPGMVLGIVFNNISMTLIESNNKKISFLEEVKQVLNLNNVEIICARMEDYAKDNEEVFDIITCRAVSNLGIISELSIKSLKVNGLFIPLKSNIDEELIKYEKDINTLGYKIIDKESYKLPIENSNRSILVLKKEHKTNSLYPRSYSKIIKSYK